MPRRRHTPKIVTPRRRLGLHRLEDRTVPATMIGVQNGLALEFFNSATPGTINSTVTITGLNAGELIEGIDFRPATGQMFGLGVAGTTARIGSFNLQTGAFTQVGAPFTVTAGSQGFGFDFNPTNDRIRVTDTVKDNLLINPNDGTVTVQGTLNPGSPLIVGSAYSNNFGTATTTTLFAIDASTSQLDVQVPATGVLSPVGPLGVSFNGLDGFDIAGDGTAFASLGQGSTASLFSINLQTGAATLIGQIGTNQQIRGLAVMRFVWDGGSGADANWTTAANWAGDIAPSAGDDLVFPAAAAKKSNNNDFPAGTLFNSFEFNGNNYNITGAAIQLAHGLESNVPFPAGGESATHFQLATTLTNDQAFEANGAFGIAFDGTLDLNVNSLTANINSGFQDMLGSISGSGAIVKNGAGFFNLFADNSYFGTSTVNAGSLVAASNLALGATGPGNGTIVNSGGTLQLEFGVTVPEDISATGTGTAGSGAINNALSDNVLNGTITLIGDTVINTNSNTSLTVAGAIGEGAAGAKLTKVGLGTLVLSGSSSNTYTGTTFVNAGTLQLNKSGGATAINGNLQIADLTSVQALAADQIADSSAVSIFGTGLLDLPFAEVIGSLTMTAGQVNAAGGLGVTTAQFTATSDAGGNAASIAGILDLGGVINVFTVNDGPGAVDLDISAAIISSGSENGGIQKEGVGTMQLSGTSANTYTGTTFVNAGTLALNKTGGVDAIPGTLVIGLFSGVQSVLLLGPDQVADTAQVQVFPSGNLDLNGFDETIGSLQMRSGAGAGAAIATGAGALSLAGDLNLIANNGGDTGATISGNLNLLAGLHTFNIADGSAANDLDISAAIGGAGGLTKIGPGTLVFSGSSSNGYTGATIVTEGTLSLAKSGAVAIAGGLSVQGGTAIETLGDQIADTAALNVALGATFDLNNLQDAVGAVNSSGLMKIGTGTLSAASFVLSSTSILAIDLNPSGNPGHVNVAGALTLGGTVQLSAATAVPTGTVRFIVDGVTPTTGQFSNFLQGTIQNIGGSNFLINYFANGGADVILTAVNPASGSISGTVFTDLNGNGANNSDPGLNGITVQLDFGADGTIDQTTTTAGGGLYTFGSLPIGVVRIRIVVPAGSIQTTPNPADINLALGQTVSNVNFGVFKLVAVSGIKFNDFNGDGIQNNGEAGVGGVTIVLTNVGTGSPPRTTTTNPDGTFSFTNVGPGTYRITEVPPAGSTQTTSNPADFTVISGTNVTGLAFGNRKKTTELFAVGAGLGGLPQVKVYNTNGTLRFSFFAYDAAFSGGVQVATGDVNGDGIDDIITGAGPGGGPHVKVFSGANLALLDSFFAYGANFSGGVFVAAGDVNRDGFMDIVTGAGASGGPHVEVFSGKNLALLRSFFAYGAAFAGGVRVGAGDVNHDGFADIITGAGTGGGPHVEVFNGQNLALLQSFLAFGSNFTGGVFVAGGDVNGDGFADVIVGQGTGGQPEVRIYSGKTGALQTHFFVYDPFFRGGVRVGVADIDGNGTADILTGAGFIGGPHVKAIDVNSLFEFQSFFAFDPAFLGGIYVG